MKRTVLLAMIAAAFAAGATRAADLYGGPYAAAPVAYPAKTWTGPYIGANVGYQLGSVTNSGADPRGVAGGVQGGYNWQYNQLVLGGEVDIQLSDADDTFAAYKFSNLWFSTLRGRVGYAMNNILLYGTGGFALGQLRAEFLGATETHLLGGWSVGAGLEVGLTPNWSARAEYMFVNLSGTNYVLTGMNQGIESSIVRFGLNYRF